jgi:hypothetical protein
MPQKEMLGAVTKRRIEWVTGKTFLSIPFCYAHPTLVLDTQFQVNNYHFWRADRTAHGGGIAAYVRSDLPCDRKRKLEFNILR